MVAQLISERDSALTERLRKALERELGPDEEVVWHGWQLARVQPRMFLIYVFAIPWTAFSLLWTGLAASAIMGAGEDGPGLIGWAFPLFGLPFIAIGLWMLAGPFLPLFVRGRVLYVVTDRRVLRLSYWRELAVKAVPAERIGLAERQEKPDGTGTLSLAVRVGRDSDGDKQTESFLIGLVDDVMGAQAAVNRIARPAGATS